jgi:hypothetical protein
VSSLYSTGAEKQLASWGRYSNASAHSTAFSRNASHKAAW